MSGLRKLEREFALLRYELEKNEKGYKYKLFCIDGKCDVYRSNSGPTGYLILVSVAVTRVTMLRYIEKVREYINIGYATPFLIDWNTSTRFDRFLAIITQELYGGNNG